jgi:hypothetical protein
MLDFDYGCGSQATFGLNLTYHKKTVKKLWDFFLRHFKSEGAAGSR